MRIAVGVLYGFDSPFLVYVLDTCMFLLATLIISLSIPPSRQIPQRPLEERECLERIRGTESEISSG